jgi:hypothetical protein
MPQNILKQITDLLERAKTEHGVYEQSVLKGAYDQEWDLWYAAWLIEHGVNDLLNADMTSPELADLLTSINNEHQRTNEPKSWAQYTAEQLVDMVS